MILDIRTALWDKEHWT